MSMLGKAGKMGEIGASEKTGGPGKTEAVSYTHLTLPTICSV